jgi:hypothetical protein
MLIHYSSGEEIHAGDVLGPELEDGQTVRVVVVIPTLEAVPGYEAAEWAHLETGVLVEHINASGVHLVHYAVFDSDFELLCRSQQ